MDRGWKRKLLTPDNWEKSRTRRNVHPFLRRGIHLRTGLLHEDPGGGPRLGEDLRPPTGGNDPVIPNIAPTISYLPSPNGLHPMQVSVLETTPKKDDVTGEIMFLLFVNVAEGVDLDKVDIVIRDENGIVKRSLTITDPATLAQLKDGTYEYFADDLIQSGPQPWSVTTHATANNGLTTTLTEPIEYQPLKCVGSINFSGTFFGSLGDPDRQVTLTSKITAGVTVLGTQWAYSGRRVRNWTQSVEYMPDYDTNPTLLGPKELAYYNVVPGFVDEAENEAYPGQKHVASAGIQRQNIPQNAPRTGYELWYEEASWHPGWYLYTQSFEVLYPGGEVVHHSCSSFKRLAGVVPDPRAVPPLVNNPPVATDLNLTLTYNDPGNTDFVLTGAGTDPDGDPLTYSYVIVDGPVTSIAGVTDFDGTTSSGTLPLADIPFGEYIIQLTVNDGLLSSDPITVTVDYQPPLIEPFLGTVLLLPSKLVGGVVVHTLRVHTVTKPDGSPGATGADLFTYEWGTRVTDAFIGPPSDDSGWNLTGISDDGQTFEISGNAAASPPGTPEADVQKFTIRCTATNTITGEVKSVRTEFWFTDSEPEMRLNGGPATHVWFDPQLEPTLNPATGDVVFRQSYRAIDVEQGNTLTNTFHWLDPANNPFTITGDTAWDFGSAADPKIVFPLSKLVGNGVGVNGIHTLVVGGEDFGGNRTSIDVDINFDNKILMP